MITHPSARGLLTKSLCIAALAATLFASLAFLFHAPAVNRQSDPQITAYAFQLLQSIKDHTAMSYMMTSRKYPLVPSIIFAVLYGATLGVFFLAGKLPLQAMEGYVLGHPMTIYLEGRFVVLLLAIATLALLAAATRKLFPRSHPLSSVLLLLSGIFFVLFSTAVRPHMIVTFATVLTLYCSLLLTEKKSILRFVAAFGSAALALAILQSGLFAMVFPFCACYCDGNTFNREKIRSALPFLLVAASIGIAVVLSYPFLLSSALWAHGTLGLGMGNAAFNESHFDGNGFVRLAVLLFGSEVLLAVIAVVGFVRALRKRQDYPFFALSLFLYVLSYSLFFGANSLTEQRMFLPLLPVLALIGAPVIGNRRWMLVLLACATVAIDMQLGILALRPDTFDMTRTFLVTETRGTIATGVAHYFFDIPQTRSSITDGAGEQDKYAASLPYDLPDARAFITLSDREHADVIVAESGMLPNLSPSWHQCATFLAARTPQWMFLWTDVWWGLFWLFRTERLGPSLDVFCRSA